MNNHNISVVTATKLYYIYILQNVDIQTQGK